MRARGRKFQIATATEDGGVGLYPMKEWLRQHPDQVPPGVDLAEDNSHKIWRRLKEAGWPEHVTASEVRLTKPGDSGLEGKIEEVFGSDDAPDDQDEEEVASFAMEYQLRDFIAENLATIPVDGRKLHVYVDATGHEGVEFQTAVGPIDILAADESGAFVVFELKRGRSPDHAIGQLSRYMGWVKQTIGKDHDVRGVIVAKSISDKLRYAVTVIPNVTLFEYEVSFQLRPAGELARQSL